MMLFSPHRQTENKKIKILENELRKLKNSVDYHEKALKLCSKTIKKATSTINEVAFVQSSHLEHTATLHEELQNLLDTLYSKDNIKYDLMNEPYNQYQTNKLVTGKCQGLIMTVKDDVLQKLAKLDTKEKIKAALAEHSDDIAKGLYFGRKDKGVFDAIQEKVISRKLLVFTVATALLWWVGLDAETWGMIAMTYIGGQTAIDFAKVWKGA